MSPRSAYQDQKGDKYSGRTVSRNSNHIIGCRSQPLAAVSLVQCHPRTWGRREEGKQLNLHYWEKDNKKKTKWAQTMQRPSLTKCLQRESNEQNTPTNWPSSRANSRVCATGKSKQSKHYAISKLQAKGRKLKLTRLKDGYFWLLWRKSRSCLWEKVDVRNHKGPSF